jgi:hypothetical protein
MIGERALSLRGKRKVALGGADGRSPNKAVENGGISRFVRT